MTSWRKKLRHAQFETNWRFYGGVGEGALSLVEFVGDAAEFAGKAAWLNAQVSFVNVLETAWESDYKQGNVKDFLPSCRPKMKLILPKRSALHRKTWLKVLPKPTSF